jgi:hypothetical protein
MEILTPAARSKATSTSTRRSSHERRVSRSIVEPELGERYGITWHDERTPEVEASFGIGS